MAQFNIPEAFVISGNSPTEKAVLSAFEAQVRAELTSDKSTMFLRMDATDEQIGELAGVAIAIYRVTTRVVWGTTWDDMEGTKRQLGQVKITKLDIDKYLTIDFNIPEFDIERFLKSPSNIGVAMVVNWTASFTRNLYENLELTFLQGAVDYAIAKSLVLPINLIKLTPDQAVGAYYTIWAKNNRLIKKVDDITVGINRNDLIGATGIDSNLGLSKAFVRLNYGQIAADTVVTGRRYTSNIAGMEFWESFYLEQDFEAGELTKMNLEKTYKLLNIHGFVTHRRMWGMPLSFTKIRQKLDNATDNIRIIGKCLFALPAAIRPDLEYIIRPTMPTIAEIEAAQAKDYLTNPNNKEATYQSCRYDNLKSLDLKNIIYFDNLPGVDIADESGIPTPSELDKALVKYGNLGFNINHAEITNITTNSAIIKPKTDDNYYYGKVEITFVKSGATETEKEPTNNEIQKLMFKQLNELQNQTGSTIDVLSNVINENNVLKEKINNLQNKNNKNNKSKKEDKDDKEENIIEDNKEEENQ